MEHNHEFVYALVFQAGFTKVGTTSNPDDRLKGIVAGCPLKETERFIFAVSVPGRYAEVMLHHRLNVYWNHHEWYRIPTAARQSLFHQDHFALSDCSFWRPKEPEFCEACQEVRQKEHAPKRQEYHYISIEELAKELDLDPQEL